MGTVYRLNTSHRSPAIHRPTSVDRKEARRQLGQVVRLKRDDFALQGILTQKAIKTLETQRPSDALIKMVAVRMAQHPSHTGYRIDRYSKYLAVFCGALMGFYNKKLPTEKYFYLRLQKAVASRIAEIEDLNEQIARTKKRWLNTTDLDQRNREEELKESLSDRLKKLDPYRNGLPEKGWEIWLEDKAEEISLALAEQIYSLAENGRRLKDEKPKAREARLFTVNGLEGSRQLVAVIDPLVHGAPFKIIGLFTLSKYRHTQNKRFKRNKMRNIRRSRYRWPQAV